jgi:Na+-transporting NADH:ubiquinone oxidoreductase subunit NqrC
MIEDKQLFMFENRQSKIEDAITKLTEISSDLNKMIAVHELRLNQQEKSMDTLEGMLERRREEADIKLKTVYDTMRAEDRAVIAEIAKLREEGEDQFEQLSLKIQGMERMMWTYMGAFAVLAFILAYGPSIIKVLNIQ